MPKKRRKKVESPIFDSIRKPTAPPAQKFGAERPETKVHPANRKAKHKKKVDKNIENGDL